MHLPLPFVMPPPSPEPLAIALPLALPHAFRRVALSAPVPCDLPLFATPLRTDLLHYMFPSYVMPARFSQRGLSSTSPRSSAGLVLHLELVADVFVVELVVLRQKALRGDEAPRSVRAPQHRTARPEKQERQSRPASTEPLRGSCGGLRKHVAGARGAPQDNDYNTPEAMSGND